MSRFHSYLVSASRILQTYTKGTPFSYHLKIFFSKEKKIGSRDRKSIAGLCYQYFRVAHLFESSVAMEDKIIYGAFICENNSHDLIESIRPELFEKKDLSLSDKFKLLNINMLNLFPYSYELSREINYKDFAFSFFQQPKFYIRIRPGKMKFIKKIQQAGIDYETIDSECFAFSQHIDLEKIADINSDFVIQDKSSQKIFDGFKFAELLTENYRALEAWDCCAASGGKSILLFDKIGERLKLTVSDIRKNILINLKERLSKAQVPVYKSFMQDLSVSSGLNKDDFFDIILCDAPCSGSGTWSRNPEQLHAFDIGQLNAFVLRQQAIVSNVIPHLRPNGYFFYVTCSVFEKENEGVIQFIQHHTNLQLEEMKYEKGYNNMADTMFVALFKN
ncbi:MAG: Fmu (Sun) domain-containing protein [Ferruginibacter sp.]|nr:Fmu (Sun) domain-containing protein [Ferruginibacter sp.]